MVVAWLRAMRHGAILLVALAAGVAAADAGETFTLFGTNAAAWRYCKGTGDASAPDLTAWRQRAFADGGWPTGAAPFFFGESYLAPGTILSDMQNQYTTLYLRRSFIVTNAAEIDSLELTAACDDGFIAWINGALVASYNPPGGDPRYNAVASAVAVEPAPFYGYPILDTGPFLVSGTNVLAIQVFNVSSGSSDLVFDAALLATIEDTSAPLVAAVSPTPGLGVTNLTRLTVTFSEPVSGVEAADLLVNEFPCVEVSGGPESYTFTPVQPAFGLVQVSWRMTCGIADLASPPNAFNPTGPRARWTYDLYDTTTPVVVLLNPPAGSTVRQLSRVEVLFDRPVAGVDAADLEVGGQPATVVTGTAAGPYVFEFGAAGPGLVPLAWALDHGIADLAPEPCRFGGGAWSCTVDPEVRIPEIRINEILAENASGIADEDGDREDWIELYNPGTSAVNLGGWSLTDDPEQPGQWVFPAVTLGARQFLVIFASAKDRRVAGVGRHLHTNFRLGTEGEYLGLYNAEAPRVAVSELAPRYAEQRVDHSYGRDPAGQWRYYAGGSPRGANPASTIVGVLGPVHFSVERGFFQKPFNVSLATAEPGTTIRYTIDGSVPTGSNGVVYTQPVTIGATRVVRAAAFRENYLPSRADTHTYLYNVAALRRYIPTLSLVTASNHLYGASGIMEYNPRNTLNHGMAWERPVSAEWIRPEDNGGFQVDCGLRIQGGGYIRNLYNYRSSSYPEGKYSFRLYFRGDYGPGRLEYPLFPGVPIASFDTVVLRAGMNDPSNPFLRDEMARQLEADTGQVAARGTFCQLYLNGVYKGYYNPTQRIDTDFLKDAYGSTNDWDIIAMGGEIREGDAAAWTALRRYADTNNLALSDKYLEIERRLDLTNFVEYLLPLLYADCDDWPHNNWRAARERKAGALYRFYAWDAEWTFGLNGSVSRDTIAGQLGNLSPPWGGAEIQTLFVRLKAAPEFRLLFADRIHKHFFNDGNLTDARIKARYDWLKAQIAPSISGYSDTIGATWIPNRRRYLTNHFQVAGLLASSNAPVFSQFGGPVPRGFGLTLSNRIGTMFYTTNGSDPRVRFSGTPAGDAQAYGAGQPIVIDRTMRVRARAQWGTNWSAVTEATFTVDAFGLPLRIVEINYNPPGGDAFEFVELQNVSPVALDLSGMHFEGIDFRFAEGAVIAGGSRLVLASDANPGAFAQRYPGVAVYGLFGGSLSNKGERLALLDATNRVIQSVDYRDAAGWPEAADGDGPSIEIIEPEGDPDDPANWRASPQPGGSPGAASPIPELATVRLNEVSATRRAAGGAPALSEVDWCELHSTRVDDVNLLGWTLSDAAGSKRFTFPAVTLAAGGFLVVVCDTNGVPGYLRADFGLDPDGDHLFLCDPQGQRVDAVTFGPQVPGFTLGRIEPNDLWRLTEPTPGTANSSAVALAPATALAINEFVANALPGADDWIELFNRDPDRPAALQGLSFATTNAVFTLTARGYVAPGGHVLLHADEDPGPNHLDFKLPAAGGFLVLSDALGRELSRASYAKAAEGVSYGRLPDGASNLVAFTTSQSPGAANYAASYGGPRLNEMLVRNVLAAPNGAGHHVGWVELFNPATNAYDLEGMSLSLGEAVPGQWVFPVGLRLEPGAYCVVWADPGRPASTAPGDELNCGLALDGDGGSVHLFNRAGQAMDSVRYGFQLADAAVGRSPSTWALLAQPTPGAANSVPAGLGNAGAIRLNEWLAEAEGDDWVELYNPDPLPVNLADLVLTDDPSLAGQTNGVIGPLTFIPGNGWARFIADGSRARAGRLPFRLDGLGETLRLYSAGLAVIDSVDLLVQAPGVSEGRFPDGGAKVVRFPKSPSPGGANCLPLESVVINEALPDPAPPLEPAIELRNCTARPVAIGGWWLSDTLSEPRKFRIPEGTIVASHGYAVLYANQFAAGEAPRPLVLDAGEGGCLVLSQCDTNGLLTGYRCVVAFGPAEPGVPFGRVETSQGPDFVATQRPTFGADTASSVEEFRAGRGGPNAPPSVGPLVIHEIMYAPSSVAGGASEAEGAEFVELHNAGDAPVDLFDPARPGRVWRLAGAVEYAMPGGLTLPSGAYVVVAPFDPATEPDRLAAFRSRYDLDETVRLLGPWSGRLDDAGATVRLEKPRQGGAAPDGGPYVLVEAVRYGAAAPWPLAAQATGLSLGRLAPMRYGNEPSNWHAAWPTPGRPNPTGSPDLDDDGLPDDWELAQGLDPRVATGPDGPNGDPDADGLSNSLEYALGTTAHAVDLVITAIADAPDGVRISFNAIPGRTYTVESRDGLEGASWQWVANLLPPQSPQIFQVKNVPPPTVTARYYRVRVL